jgi:hypothetical protein
MTGPEVAEAERKARERLARQALKGKAIETVRDEDITVIDKVELVIVTTLRPTTPPASIIRKRSHSIMVDRTPKSIPSPMIVPVEDELVPSDFNLPPSTAPVATGRVRRTGRVNKVNS